MAQFNLADYETVEERLKRAHKEHPDLRIVTLNCTTPQDRQQSMWVVEARIYLNRDDQQADLPKATGWAFEIDGAGMANKTSALENCETSSIGRALANMNLSGNKRTSREEMEKVERGITPRTRDWVAEAQQAKTKDAIRLIYADAVKAKAPQAVLARLIELGKADD